MSRLTPSAGSEVLRQFFSAKLMIGRFDWFGGLFSGQPPDSNRQWRSDSQGVERRQRAGFLYADRARGADRTGAKAQV